MFRRSRELPLRRELGYLILALRPLEFASVVAAFTVAIAAHIERRRRTRGLTDVDALQQDVLRELERLRFAVPSSSARWRVLRLAECGFSHKEVVLSEIRGRLSPACKSAIKGDSLDKCIAKSFVASKRKQHPAHAALILVEARADELAKGQ